MYADISFIANSERSFMYIPKHFKVDDQEELLRFVDQNSFAQLISQHEEQLCSTHLPCLLNEGKDEIICHLARANPQHHDINGQEVLLSFQGPHAYIYPTWYQESGVPTWNFQAVHVYGKAERFEDPELLKQCVEDLSKKNEELNDSQWNMQYPEGLLKAIVGVKISITEIQGKYKLSQNKSAEDQQGVIDALERAGSQSLAQAMSAHKKGR